MPRFLVPLFLGVTLMAFCAAPAHAFDIPAPAADAPLAAKSGSETIVLAGGCFWGIQAVFQHLKGVTSAISGYSGGEAATANYAAVSSGKSGHAESVKVTFDPSQITVGQILRIFFAVAHDPTELNRQGPDRGTQYRSAIFFSSPEQQKIAADYIKQLDATKIYGDPIVTQVAPLQKFYPAEDYEQNYATLHPNSPYIIINDAPKVEALRKQFPDLYHKG